jgi:hypothetical protein
MKLILHSLFMFLSLSSLLRWTYVRDNPSSRVRRGLRLYAGQVSGENLCENAR